MDKNILITITGGNNYFGKKPFKVGRVLKLAKEPDNNFDCEAIKATLPYIALSVMSLIAYTQFMRVLTVLADSMINLRTAHTLKSLS